MAYEIDRNRELYRLRRHRHRRCCRRRSARCVGTARVLYAQILDRIEAADYDVFSRRVRVPTWRKALTAARIMVTGPRTERRLSRRARPTTPEFADQSKGQPCHCAPGDCPTSGPDGPAAGAGPVADPDRPGAAAARGPDAADLAAGQAGPDRRVAGGVAGAELRRLVRGRRRAPTSAATESVARTIAGREVVFWRNADGSAGGRSRRLPAPGCAAGRLPGDGRDRCTAAGTAWR